MNTKKLSRREFLKAAAISAMPVKPVGSSSPKNLVLSSREILRVGIPIMVIVRITAGNIRRPDRYPKKRSMG